jgi:hypothetical protein
VARALADICQGPTIVRHASTQTYVNSDRSQTKDLRQSENIPYVRNAARHSWKNGYDRSGDRCD